MPRGIYEAWCIAGGEEQEGPISATEAKPIGAYIIIATAWRKFRIYHDERSFDNRGRGCWKLSERQVLGSGQTCDTWEPYGEEFRSLKEAKRTAVALALGKDRTNGR